jgi:prevent-host-death family protein
MTDVVNIHEAKTHLSRLLERVQAGEEIIIAKAGRPVAILSPASPPDRISGLGKGQVVIHDDFDDPIPEFEEYA